MNQRHGFTLIEVIVMLAVIAILAAMAVPAALRIFQVTTESATRTEMATLRNAIFGDATKIQNGVRTDFGYAGDVGCLPTSLQDLLTIPGGVAAYAFNAAAQIGAGWNGPYITGAATGEGTEVFTNDQWGNAYIYTPSACAAPLAAPLTAAFYSWGPDGASDAGAPDDISYPVVAAETSSTVSGYVKDPNGNPVGSSTVRINYPLNGTLTTLVNATTDATGFYQFASPIPFGKRSISFPSPSISPRLVVTAARNLTGATAFCGTAGTESCYYVEFTLVNFATAVAGVTVSTIRPTYSSACCASPGPWYYRINWQATTQFDCTTAANPSPCRGESTPGANATRTLTASQNIAAAAGLAPTVFVIDNAQEQVPDIVVGKSGQVGTAVRVQLINFRNCQRGPSCTPAANTGGTFAANSVNMTGVAFTILFSDGSTVYFTP